MQNIDPAGQPFDHPAHIRAGMLHPIYIQHKGYIIRVQPVNQVLHGGPSVLQTPELKIMIMICELTAMHCQLRGQTVCLPDKSLGSRDAASVFARHTADAHVGGAEPGMLAQRPIHIRPQNLPVIMRADHFQAGFFYCVRKGLNADEKARRLHLRIAHGRHFLQRAPNVRLIRKAIPDPIQL